ncbi:DUF354 domain-containing protein [Spirosoma sp. BT702]|uniref:DUF354 domain-containing protein n=1 Tax=Spirosoma profusum TaxID=2771354 RepID=A0A926XUK9_9BACT|nr:DUF354 domain-containing protein [Spirosoma profusum]MBD2700703.1 DUF354 domain-containing protein [Spirosoma profusum]
MKRILVDINHPAHVHLFKYFIQDAQSAGHEVVVTAKNIDSVTDLLRLYQIKFINIGNRKDHILLKYIYEFVHFIKVLLLVRSRKINYGIGVSLVLPLVSKLTPMKSFVLDDDDLTAAPISGKFISWADVILNPDALAHEKRGHQQVCYPSYHELAYLHPNRFVPDPTVLNEAGIQEGETFFVLRFNAFKAHHDAGIRGFSLAQKLELVKLLSAFGQVFITSERSIESELEPYQLPVSADKIHSLLHFATLFIGDSQTMTTEAAILGTPALKMNSFAGRLSIPNELEHQYRLCYSFSPDEFDGMIAKIKELLIGSDVKERWAHRKAVMLNEKIDLTSFLIQLILHYPKSIANQKPIFSANESSL